MKAHTVLINILITACLFGCRRHATIDDEHVAAKLGLSKQLVAGLRRSAGLSPSEFINLSPDELRETVREVGHADLPLARERYRALLEASENGRVPEGARFRAVLRLNLLKNLVSGRRFAVAGVPVSTNHRLPLTAGINPDRSGWLSLGPSEVGGRTRSIVFNPQNPREMWIGSVAGGIWHSTDGGETFQATDDFMSNLVISTMVIDPFHTGTIYAGTGEGFTNSDALRGAGIYRTFDGNKWSQIDATANEHFRYVNRVAISPDGKTLLAATADGIFVSADSEHSVWSVTPTLPGNIADVVFHPSDSKQAIAAGLDTGEVYYSIDSGMTWKKSSHDGNWVHMWSNGQTSPSRVEVTYAVADPSVVYASVDNNNGEIWRSKDGGRTFVKTDSVTSDGPLAYYLGDQGWYDNSIWAGDPQSADLLIVGGIDLWKSSDGGQHLSPISDWQNNDNVLHPDQHAVVSPPIPHSEALFVSNDGGLFKTEDLRSVGSDEQHISGWVKLARNYSVTQFYGAAWSPHSGVLIGGAQDNGTLLLPKGGKPSDWTVLFAGDGGNCAVDPVDANYLYGEYVDLDIFRSSDGGKNAEEISGEFWNAKSGKFEWKNPPYVITDARDLISNFIAPFVLDPNDPKTILGGGASLWRTNDAKTPNTAISGPQWRPIKPPGPGFESSNPGAGPFISAIAIPTQNSNIIWLGDTNGNLFRTANGKLPNPSWVTVNSKRQGAPSRIVTRIVVDPTNSNIVYVTYGGYSESGKSDNVWKTINGGSAWVNLSTSLPSAPSFVLTLHPHNRNYVYLGTEVGLFSSEDGGAHWSPTNEGPTNAAVMDLIWMGGTLAAITHGRGIFDINLKAN